MKLNRLLIFACFICIVTLAGCNKESLVESKYGSLPSNDGVEIHFTHNKYPDSVKTMNLDITNNGSAAITYDVRYQLEIWKNGHWYQLPFKKDIGWSAIAFLLKPKESAKLTVSSDVLKEPFTKGKYRLIKKFYTTGSSNRKIITVAAPFEIE